MFASDATAEVRDKACLLVSVFIMSPSGQSGANASPVARCPGAGACRFSRVRDPINQRQVGGVHQWGIDFSRWHSRTTTFRLRMRIPLKDLASFSMPDVALRGVHAIDRWLAVTGFGLRPEKMKGLVKVQDITKELLFWPSERLVASRTRGLPRHIREPRIGTWTSQRLETTAPVKILLAEEQAEISQYTCRRWVHQSGVPFAPAGRLIPHL